MISFGKTVLANTFVISSLLVCWKFLILSVD